MVTTSLPALQKAKAPPSHHHHFLLLKDSAVTPETRTTHVRLSAYPPGAAQAAKPCSACGKLIPAVSIALHRTKCALRTERRKQKKKKKKNAEITTAGLAFRNTAAGPDSLSEVEGGTQHGVQLNGCSQGDAGVAGQWTKDAIKDRYSS